MPSREFQNKKDSQSIYQKWRQLPYQLSFTRFLVCFEWKTWRKLAQSESCEKVGKRGRGKREHLCSRRYKTSKWCVKFDNKHNTTSEAIKERAIAMGEGERESRKEGEAQPVNELMVRGHSIRITCYKFDMLMTSVRDSLGRLAEYNFFASSSSFFP